MFIIGMTGGIGCGKSEICRYLADRYDAVLIEADRVAHEIMEPGTRCYDQLRTLFTEQCLSADGRLDRQKIGEIVFRDPKLLEQMNAIVHPEVWKEINARIEDAKWDRKKLVVIEAALLVGTKYREICDEFWNVRADRDVRILRLSANRHITPERAEAVMDNQMSEEEFEKGCDFTIDNSGNFADTRKAVDARLAGRNLS